MSAISALYAAISGIATAITFAKAKAWISEVMVAAVIEVGSPTTAGRVTGAARVVGARKQSAEARVRRVDANMMIM